jgi:hypothetical protein
LADKDYGLYKNTGTLPTPPQISWKHFPGYNCYDSKGSRDIETPMYSAAGEMELTACQEACAGTSACTGVVYEKKTRKCYRRADIDPSKCDSQIGYALYQRTGPAPAPTPAPPAPTPPAPKPTPAPGPGPSGTLQTYPAPDSTWKEELFTVTAALTGSDDVQKSFVYFSYPKSDAPSAQKGKKLAYTTFSFEGEVVVTVKKLFWSTNGCVIKPARLALTCTDIGNNMVTITLTKSAKFSVEFADDPNQMNQLLIFADALEV